MPDSMMLRGRVRFFSPGTIVLLAVMAVGYGFGLARLITGLGPVTNLTNQYPWGIWIAIDVASGVALAAGGFTVAALVNIFGRRRYHVLERPALLTAWLGYSFVAIGLLFDLGRYYNIWHPMVYWQGNSVLFEVGMCVMFYLTVLTIEMAPALLSGLIIHMNEGAWLLRGVRGLSRFLERLQVVVRKILPLFIIAGVVLSFMHQSSLGSLMLIAPTKVSPLWWTPILPVLFLLSAIMVGFPVVIFESIAASRAFGRAPEMKVLTPLSRILPWTVGLYGVVKIVDLLLRNDLSVFLLDPSDTVAWLMEVGVGIIVPVIMLLQPSVRRSPRWLFISVSLIIAGVVLNRINVFLVGFHPPFGEVGYFPSVGEIALTAALISTLIFVYRFVVLYFPILEREEADEEGAPGLASAAPRVAPIWAWIARGLAVLLFVGFIVIYSAVHFDALEQTQRSFQSLEFSQETHTALDVDDPIAIPEQLSFSKEAMPALIWIDRSITNSTVDDYEPVRFMHKAHAARLDGDCSVCHHRGQESEGDRVGRALGPEDLKTERPSSCAVCHQRTPDPEHPMRPGLKGAYHQQCLGCHAEQNVGAPTSCDACHHGHVPDHAGLVQVTGQPTPQQITGQCLECHPQQGRDVVRTAHWNWSGPSPYTQGHEHRTDLGKAAVFNNYCIHVGSNIARCAQCHAGYGWVDDEFDFSKQENIDCLSCHDTTGTYRKSPENGGLPAEDVNLVKVAQSVGRPTRAACGRCHFYGGGGANVKHGDLEPALVDPPASFDVHMGEHGMRCQDCHVTDQHRIAGQSSSIPTSEGRVRCESCHGDHPHALDPVLGRHLDRHTASLACQTCHIPHFAKQTPTKMFWDWSKAGQDRPETVDELGMPTFSKKKGEFRWEKDVTPCYQWYNGTHERYLLGDRLSDGPDTVLNQPRGSIEDPAARIFPFKCYAGVQPMDAERRILAVPKLWKGFWEHLDWDRAVRDGMTEVGLEYSGQHGFTKTRMFWAINHEVVPQEKALGCADCHAPEAVTCSRCHGDQPELSAGTTSSARYPNEATPRMDFRGLGYKDDPAKVGARGRLMPLPSQDSKERKSP